MIDVISGELLWRDDWHTITIDPANSLTRWNRSALPYPTLLDAERSHEAVLAIRHPGFGKTVLLFDLRLAPPRNDPAFEALSSRAVHQFTQHFQSVVVLLKSKVGMLQVSRLSASIKAKVQLFDDEKAALASVRERAALLK